MLILTLTCAFVISVLSGLGIGGGGLFVIYLTLFTDTPQLVAQGLNLLFFLFSAGASLPIHLMRRSILGSAVLIMTLAGILGSLTGSLLSSVTNEALLRKIFGAMLSVSGIFSLRRILGSKKGNHSNKESGI